MSSSQATSQLKRRFKGSLSAYLFLAPALFFFSTFVLYPMLKGLALSMYRFRGRNEHFTGLANYQSIFTDDVFLRAVFNTLCITALAVPIVVCLSLFVAMNIYKMQPSARSFYRGVFYLPAISSVVSVTVVWAWIYHPQYGILNYFFKSIGVLGENVDWLGSSHTALFCIIAILITTSIGQPIILYVASLGNVPSSYIEAAKIDGAGPWRIFFSVILPLVKPTTLYIVVVTTINSFQIFALIQLLTAGGPNYKTTTVMYLIYERAIGFGDYGRASAMGVVLALVIASISLLQFKFLSSDVEY